LKGTEQALADCLDRIELENASIEEALAPYPELRGELEPLLRLACELRAAPKLTAPESLRSWKRPVFSAQPALPRADRQPRKWSRLLLPSAPVWPATFARLAAALAAASLVLGGTAVASAASLPGDPLYPAKLAMENAQLALAFGSSSRAELEMQLASRRLEEVESAARQGKIEAVQQGLALYEERLESAVRSAEQLSASNEGEGSPLREVLERQQQLLVRVLAEAPDQAKPAIQHAIEVSRQQRVPLDTRGEMKQASQPEPVAAPTAAKTSTTGVGSPSPTPTSGRPTLGTSSAPQVADEPTREAHRKPAPTAAVGGQREESSEAPKDSGQTGAGERHRGDDDKTERRDTLSASPSATPTGTMEATTATPTVQPSPTARSATPAGSPVSATAERSRPEHDRGDETARNARSTALPDVSSRGEREEQDSLNAGRRPTPPQTEHPPSR